MIRILLAFVMLHSASVAAREWIVSPSGDDSEGQGTLAKPYRTLTHVLETGNDIVHAGDTVTLRGPPGKNVYAECSARLLVKINLRSYPGERAHIQCDTSVEDSSVLRIDADASGSLVSNLELSGSQWYGVKMDTDWDRNTKPNGIGASHVTLENLEIHDTGHDGIKITPKSNHVTIRHSEIRNTGVAYSADTPADERNADGIDNVGGSNMLVEDNYIHDIASTGLYFKGGASDVVVQRNRIENVGSAGIRVGFDTSEEFFDTDANPKYYESIRGIVRNNVIRNARYAGIGIHASLDAIVVNNTIVNTASKGQAAIFFGISFQDDDPAAGRPPSVNPLIRNNLVIQNGGDCVEIRWSPKFAGLAALTGNPNTDWNGYYNSSGSCRFVDWRPSALVLLGGAPLARWQSHEETDSHSVEMPFAVDETGHLSANSPAVGRGVNIKQVTDDIDGERRSVPYDIGADQFVEVGISAPAKARKY